MWATKQLSKVELIYANPKRNVYNYNITVGYTQRKEEIVDEQIPKSTTVLNECMATYVTIISGTFETYRMY